MQFHEVVCTHIPSGDILFVIELEDLIVPSRPRVVWLTVTHVA